jgi:acyl carrier protein
MADGIDERCVAVFRAVADLRDDPAVAGLGLDAMLARPIESFDIDSLTTMEFIMAVEEEFGVELDEGRVNACGCIADIAALVREAR